MTKEFLSEYGSTTPIVECDRSDCRIIKNNKYQNEVYDKHGNVLAENCSGSEMKCLVCGKEWKREEL
jgi:hypothetical protein